MVFLFVGSSALTEASFPRDLAIPQLLLSSACAIVLTMKASPTAVFPHRGLAPHQFTPMSGAHKPDAANPAMALWLTIEDQWRRVADLERSAKISVPIPKT
jgi:hypothetical protein